MRARYPAFRHVRLVNRGWHTIFTGGQYDSCLTVPLSGAESLLPVRIFFGLLAYRGYDLQKAGHSHLAAFGRKPWHPSAGILEVEESEAAIMKNHRGVAAPVLDRAPELRVELARKIARFMGSAERRETCIPGLTLVRRVSTTAPCSMTYEPSLTVIAQGRKRVELGRTSFFYDSSRFLLTAVDLPVISCVLEASEEVPCLAMSLKLEMPMVRELLGRVEIPVAEAPSDSPAMATGETTVEFLSACCRLVDLLDTPQDIPFLSGLIQREIIYRVLRSAEGERLRAIATLGEQSQRTARAIAWIRENYTKPLRVEDLAEIAGMGVSTLHHHFRMLTAMSPLQYQKQIRLQAARGRMLMDGLDAASAAFEVGYESASQFSREYSRFFGQPPMRDIRTLRSPSAPPIESVASR
jgi:AraC-like DNA-binding protein